VSRRSREAKKARRAAAARLRNVVIPPAPTPDGALGALLTTGAGFAVEREAFIRQGLAAAVEIQKQRRKAGR
jgi:hypothetical protein